MIDQASKTKNSVDLVKELRRMERDNLEDFLEHLQNFSDTWLDAMADFYILLSVSLVTHSKFQCPSHSNTYLYLVA